VVALLFVFVFGMTQAVSQVRLPFLRNRQCTV